MTNQASNARMPVAFLPHGGGPWPWVELDMVPPAEHEALMAFLRSVPALSPQRPRALVVISAHWEERVPTVMSAAAPPMLYDYGGFPPETYQLQWPAPGDPELAARVRQLLGNAGFQTAEDRHRGYDHGTFVPLKVAFPEAAIPVVQLSLISSLDPEEHLAMGRALAPLRSEGVFILGSGNTFHNMRGFLLQPVPARPGATRFNAWLESAAVAARPEREEHLRRWAEAPDARFCHPREEHLLPLHVVAGAAENDAGHVTWAGTFGTLRNLAFHYA